MTAYDLTPTEAALIDAIRIGNDGELVGKAFAVAWRTAHPEDWVKPTPPTPVEPPPQAPIPPYKPAESTSEATTRGFLSTEAIHLRQAVAIVGALVGLGALDIDFGDSDCARSWFDDFDSWASIAARTLDMLDY